MTDTRITNFLKKVFFLKKIMYLTFVSILIQLVKGANDTIILVFFYKIK